MYFKLLCALSFDCIAHLSLLAVKEPFSFTRDRIRSVVTPIVERDGKLLDTGGPILSFEESCLDGVFALSGLP